MPPPRGGRRADELTAKPRDVSSLTEVTIGGSACPPYVTGAAVVAVPDDKWGECPLATVVLRKGATTGFETLRAFLAEEGGIAKWQLPERWTAVEAVPETSVGKFDTCRPSATAAVRAWQVP